MSRDGGETLDSAEQMNHWLAASELVGSASASAPVSCLGPAALGIKGTVAKAMVYDSGIARVSAFYRALGLIVHETVAQGDCGVDAVLTAEGKDRNSVAYQRWRADLMRAMWDCADHPDWQQAFSDCAEAWRERKQLAAHRRRPRALGPPPTAPALKNDGLLTVSFRARCNAGPSSAQSLKACCQSG